MTRGEKRYFVTSIDNFSKYCYIYLINTKNELYNTFKIYKILVENQLDNKIISLRLDRGGEYISKKMYGVNITLQRCLNFVISTG